MFIYNKEPMAGFHVAKSGGRQWPLAGVDSVGPIPVPPFANPTVSLYRVAPATAAIDTGDDRTGPAPAPAVVVDGTMAAISSP